METVFDDGDEKSDEDLGENSALNESAVRTLGNLGWLSCQTVGGFSEIILRPSSDMLLVITPSDDDESSIYNTITL